MAIHQPRSDIFKLLDNVMILSSGEVVYSGKSDRLVPYFTELGYPCPGYANPLDHYSKYTIKHMPLAFGFRLGWAGFRGLYKNNLKHRKLMSPTPQSTSTVL